MLPLSTEKLLANLEIANSFAAAVVVVFIALSSKKLVVPVSVFIVALLLNFARILVYLFHEEWSADLVFAGVQAFLSLTVVFFLVWQPFEKFKSHLLFIGAAILWLFIILGAFFGNPDPRLSQVSSYEPLHDLSQGFFPKKILFIHITLASMGGTFATLNFLSALFYWRQLSNLKQKKFSKILPSLNTLDTLCLWCNNLSLGSISLSLVSGFLLLQTGLNLNLVSPAKLVWSFGIWISAISVLFFRLPKVKSSSLVQGAEHTTWANPFHLPLWLLATLLGTALVILSLFGTVFRSPGG
jgi:hypothetical protein